MNRIRHLLVATAFLLVLATSGHSFSLTASSFKGFHAFDKGGDVVGTFGLDPRFSYANTGQNFNFAAGLQFDVCYNPYPDPTLQEVQSNPGTDYLWTLSINDAKLPWGQDLNFTGSTVASASEIMGGVHWLQNAVSPHLPSSICTAFDVQWVSPTKGVASAFLAGNLNPDCLPWWTPNQYICPWESSASITVSAREVCPQNAVPEPITMILFGTGLAGFGLTRRLRKKEDAV